MSSMLPLTGYSMRRERKLDCILADGRAKPSDVANLMKINILFSGLLQFNS